MFTTVTTAPSLWRPDTTVLCVMTLIFVLLVIRRKVILTTWRNLVLILMVEVETQPMPPILRKLENSVFRGVFRAWCMLVNVEMPTVACPAVTR